MRKCYKKVLRRDQINEQNRLLDLERFRTVVRALETDQVLRQLQQDNEVSFKLIQFLSSSQVFVYQNTGGLIEIHTLSCAISRPFPVRKTLRLKFLQEVEDVLLYGTNSYEVYHVCFRQYENRSIHIN